MTVRQVAALMRDGAPAEDLARGARVAALPEEWRAMFARRAEAALRRPPA